MSDRLSQAQRDLYLAQRTAGDARALARGRLPERLLKRVYHRQVIGILRRLRVW